MSESTQSQVQQIKYTERMMYEKLEEQEHLQPVQQDTEHAVSDEISRQTMAPPKYSSLDKKQKKALKEDYAQMKAKSTFVSARDMQSPYLQKKLQETKKINGHKYTQQQLYDLALKENDCSQLEKLDAVLRNRAATEYIREYINKHKNETADNIVRGMKFANPKNYISDMMNPLLRAGISLVLHSDTADDAMKAKYRRLDELLNTEIMRATLTKSKASMPPSITPEEKQENIAAQKFMMKTLLACHIGRLQRKDNGVPHDWEGNVANAFAHCSRVVMIMPGMSGDDYSGVESGKMLAAFQGSAPFHKRGGATHNLALKRKDGTKEAKEKKSFTPFNQWGMNVAVGGLGNAGIPGPKGQERLLKNDGSCGHLYMHLEKGGKNEHPGLLLGFESDQFRHTNQQGHTHDIIATGEKASSFGGQRVDEIGDKYGGREVDLSEVDEHGFTLLMDFVDQVLDKMYNHPTGEFDYDLDDMAKKLCGGLMDDTQIRQLLDNLVEIGQRYQISVGLGGADYMNLLIKV